MPNNHVLRHKILTTLQHPPTVEGFPNFMMGANNNIPADCMSVAKLQAATHIDHNKLNALLYSMLEEQTVELIQEEYYRITPKGIHYIVEDSYRNRIWYQDPAHRTAVISIVLSVISLAVSIFK